MMMMIMMRKKKEIWRELEADFENDRFGGRERDEIVLRQILPKVVVNKRGRMEYLKINIGGWLCVNELLSGNRLSIHTEQCRKLFS
jgi:hypothetical protein